ncbi:MAG: M91 family zinc metallopeptidase [bacterium]|nr:M91 family zinc metallopeptidase [bacterium]
MINNISCNTVNSPILRPETAPAAAPQSPCEEASVSPGQDGFEAQGSSFEGYSHDVKDLAQRLAVANKCEASAIKVIGGGDGDDNINISKGEKPGEVIVDVNGEKTVLTSDEAKRTVIDGGKGNDTITIDKGLYQGMYITGGEGNDTITAGQMACTIIDNYGSNFITGSGCYDTIIANGYDLDPNAPAVSFPNAPADTEGIAVNGNIIFGGGGNDYIEGSRANDYIDAGNGNNTVYGMGGDDFITAGKGNSYLSGGEGNDVIRGGEGKNILVGGHGNDRIFGGPGHDVIVGGEGQDQIQDGQKGQYDRSNTIYANSQSTVTPSANDKITILDGVAIPSNLVIQGEAVGSNPVSAQPGTAEFHEQNGRLAFQERVIDDLETLASLPSGQTMLNALGEEGKKVDFLPTDKGNSCRHFEGAQLNDRLEPGPGSNSEVNYNRSKISSGGLDVWSERPPLVGMFHEMCHSYNAAKGDMDRRFLDPTGRPAQCAEDWLYSAPGCEYQAVGIPNPAVKANPAGLTENSLRADLSLINRDAY